MAKFKCLSLKEIVSIIQLIVAIICITDHVLLSTVFRFPADVKMFVLQCTLITTAIVCILLALSTWFYNSNNRQTRLHVRIFSVIVQWILVICIVITTLTFSAQYSKELINEYFERDIFDKSDLTMLGLGGTLAYVAAILLAVVATFQTVMLLWKLVRKQIRKRRRV